MEGNPFLSEYWVFHWLNFALSVVAYTLIGRALLGFFVPPTSGNYIMRFFCRVTDPVMKVGAYVTPGFFVESLKPLWIAGLVLFFRFVVGLIFLSLGWVALPAGV